MQKVKVFYIFKRKILVDIKNARKGIFPKDFFYGAASLNNNLEISFSDIFFQYQFLKKIQSLLYILLLRLFRIGFSIVTVTSQLQYIKRSDVVFATVDSIGLPLLMLKSLKLISQPVIVNTGGLCDSLIESNSNIYIKVSSLLTRRASTIVSGASTYECQQLSRLLTLPLNKFKFIPFGIDTNYFMPGRNKSSQEFILIIGADLKRDWDLVKEVAERFLNFNFLIITIPELIKIPLPNNCKVIYNQPVNKVRKYIIESKFLLILSKQNYHFAGQSTAFRAMSCAKCVIFTRSFGVDEYKIKNYQEAIMVRPSSFSDVKKAIIWISENENRLTQIGKNAREYILNNCNYLKSTQSLAKIIIKSVD